MSNFTQPICGACWNNQNPGRPPHRFKDDKRETCAFCGNPTHLGIYVRVDPTTVAFPTLKEGE